MAMSLCKIAEQFQRVDDGIIDPPRAGAAAENQQREFFAALNLRHLGPAHRIAGLDHPRAGKISRALAVGGKDPIDPAGEQLIGETRPQILLHDGAANAFEFGRQQHRPGRITAEPNHAVRAKGAQDRQRTQQRRRHAVKRVENAAHTAPLYPFDRERFQFESFFR